MWRYLLSAFLFAPPLGGLGRLPLNLIVLAGFAILGFGHPGFLLLGLGLEIGYLFTFATNRRFQRLIDSAEETEDEATSELRRQALLTRLKPASRSRLAAQEEKCIKIGQAYHDSAAAEILMVENGKALNKLLWAYLALLNNRDRIESLDTPAKNEDLRARIKLAEGELAQGSLTETVRASKQATLEILRKQQENAVSRKQHLSEIDSALARIEAQLDLALENSLMPERHGAIAADIEIASTLLDESSYGEFSAALEEIDSGRQRDRIGVRV